LAEIRPAASVSTTDADFHVFRRLGRDPIPLTAPFGEAAKDFVGPLALCRNPDGLGVAGHFGD
jgi:hypothetical protein